MRHRYRDVSVWRARNHAHRKRHIAPGCRLSKGRAGFAGFDPAAFAFLRGLAANNEKTWFEANRATYEHAVKAPMAALVMAVADDLRAKDIPLEGDPKRSGFRIHRDVRFSKDKRPYKTEIGSVWYRQGSGKDGAGVLYFHLAPGACFGATAFYMPGPETLGAIRERIRAHPERYVSMTDRLDRSGLALSTADTLSRMPRGFEDLVDSPVAAALKLKSFIVRRDIPDPTVQTAALVAALTGLAADTLPLLQFGWAAVDEARTA